jgi:hypothetical protein
MSTRGIIAYGTPSNWVGVFNRASSYPEYMGPELQKFIEHHGAKGLVDRIEATPQGFFQFPEAYKTSGRVPRPWRDVPRVLVGEGQRFTRDTFLHSGDTFIEWVWVVHPERGTLYFGKPEISSDDKTVTDLDLTRYTGSASDLRRE